MPALRSPYARLALKRNRRRLIRQRAPRHPVGPEAQLRATVTRTMTAFHRHIRAVVVAHARSRTDSLKSHSLFAGLHSVAGEMLRGARESIADAAKRLAKSVREQVAKALGADAVVDLSSEADDLAGDVYDSLDDRMTDSINRAFEIYGELDLDLSPRASDFDALDGMLDDGLGGLLRRALQGVAIAYGSSFADMNQSAQAEAGAATYLWCAQHDSAVRPEHAALDDKECDWDDPPLSAEESSSGEECHAGEDFNCRCVASPIPPDLH